MEAVRTNATNVDAAFVQASNISLASIATTLDPEPVEQDTLVRLRTIATDTLNARYLDVSIDDVRDSNCPGLMIEHSLDFAQPEPRVQSKVRYRNAEGPEPIVVLEFRSVGKKHYRGELQGWKCGQNSSSSRFVWKVVSAVDFVEEDWLSDGIVNALKTTAQAQSAGTYAHREFIVDRFTVRLDPRWRIRELSVASDYEVHEVRVNSLGVKPKLTIPKVTKSSKKPKA